MSFTRILLTLLFFLPGSSWLSADELLEETQTLCTNIKSCVLEQMAGEDLSPEKRQQMERPVIPVIVFQHSQLPLILIGQIEGRCHLAQTTPRMLEVKTQQITAAKKTILDLEIHKTMNGLFCFPTILTAG